jgi:PPM family protein phosphatase
MPFAKRRTYIISVPRQTYEGIKAKVDRPSDDRLQRRIAEFLTPATSSRAVNGGEEVCVGTNLGAVRKQNEDRALILFVSYPGTLHRDFVLGVVSDGIGGLSRGDEASVIAISEFCAQMIRQRELALGARLMLAADAANEAIFSLLKGKGGATLSAVAKLNGQIFGVNIGDSRIYSISSDKKLTQLSKDDTLAGYLGRHDGRISRQMEGNLVQYVGMGKGLEPHIIPIKNELQSILITSDGIHGAPQDALLEVARASRTNLELLSRLLSLSTILGGRDNATGLMLARDFLPERSSQNGITVTCISPFDRLEIWMPSADPLGAHENKPTTKGADKEISTHRTLSEKEKRSLKKRNRSKKGPTKEGGLPLEDETPTLDISFPEKHE